MRKIISHKRKITRSSNSNQVNPSSSFWNSKSGNESTNRRKKGSVLLIVFVIMLGIGMYFFVNWYSTRTAEKARKESPNKVVQELIHALGRGNKSQGEKFIKGDDNSASTQLSVLFSNYSQYTIGDDYIEWSRMRYESKEETEEMAEITLSGDAEIIEVEKNTYTDINGDEIEEEIETSVEQYSFTEINFKLKKFGDEWFLIEIPDTIF